MLGLATRLSTGGASLLTYIKDNLKLYLDFKSNRSDTLAFPSEGSTSFDGSSDYINCGASNGIASGTNFTLACWFKSADTDDSKLMQLKRTSSGSNLSLDVNVGGSAGYVGAVLRHSGNGNTTVSADGSVDDGAWHHLALTTTSSAQVLYLDGVSIATGTVAFVDLFSTDPFTIGGIDGSSYAFGGSMANVGVWTRVLSLEEINSVMNKSYSQLGSVEKTSLVMWHSLDSASNGVVQPHDGETLGSDLFPTTNAHYDVASDGVWAKDSATPPILTYNDGGNGSATISASNISISAGTYKLTFTVSDLSSGTADITFYNAALGETYLAEESFANGTYTRYFIASTGAGFRFRSGTTSGSSFKVSNYSIKRVTSNTGVVTGATTTTSIYGSNAPILNRAIDIAESFADKIGNGSALFAGGTSDEHIVTPKMSINFNSFSVSLWVKPVSFSSDDSFINIADTDSNDEEFLLYNKASANNQFSAFLPVPNTEYNSTYEIPTGEWSHLAFTKSGNTLKLYANGIEVHSGSCVNDNTYSRNLFIGARKQSSITLEMNSYIAGVGLWQGGLSQSQIQSVMESTSYAKIPADVKSTLGSDELPSPDLTSGTGLTIAQGSTGTLTHDTSAGTITATNDVQDGYLRWNSASLVENKLYKLEIVVDSYTGGRFRTTLGWNGTSFYPSVGTNIQYFIGSSTASFGIRIDDGNPAEFVISKISVKKVTNDLVGYWALDADNSIPALSFDGSNDYINFGNNSSLQFSGSFSIGCWFKTTDASSSNEHLFSKSNGGADAGFGLMLDSSRKIKFIYHQSGENDSGFSSTDVTDSGSAINDGEWHHVMGVYTSGSKIELFKDGASIGSSTSNVGVLPSHVPNLFIGGRDAGNKQVHACEVSSASAYNVAKSASEILAMYNDGIDKDESSNSGLVGYWKMDNGTTVSDLSSNSNNGTVNGATLIENAVALDSTSNNNDGSLN